MDHLQVEDGSIRDSDSLYQKTGEELREGVRKAEFWISLLEGPKGRDIFFGSSEERGKKKAREKGGGWLYNKKIGEMAKQKKDNMIKWSPTKGKKREHRNGFYSSTRKKDTCHITHLVFFWWTKVLGETWTVDVLAASGEQSDLHEEIAKHKKSLGLCEIREKRGKHCKAFFFCLLFLFFFSAALASFLREFHKKWVLIIQKWYETNTAPENVQLEY